MIKACLTIDDGPSGHFESLVDFLTERQVPAVFFNRGDAMEARPDAVIYGIKKGYVMGNHAYSHRRFSKLQQEKCYEEILATETILNDLYRKSGVPRPAKYFRFPYMDRGMGPYLLEPDTIPDALRPAHRHMIGAGLGHEPARPDAALIEKKRALQDFLRAQGFEKLPVPGVTVPIFAETEMAEAIDSLCTFSTSDWALSERHRGRHGFNTLEDLKRQIDEDEGLADASSAHIILAHDQAEIFDVTCALVDYFLEKGFVFSV